MVLIAFYVLQEIQYMEEEQHRVKNTLQSRVKDREEEIQKLRNQVGPTEILYPALTPLDNPCKTT